MSLLLSVVLLSVADGDPVVKEQLIRVEGKLRAASTAHLTKDANARRSALIDTLTAYRKRAVFPHNHQHPGGRHPVFIDEHGSACAVAYLMIASGNERLAHEIAATENLARVPAMTHPAVGAWAEHHGFTLDELTAIQPGYAYRPGSCDVAATWVASPNVSYLLTHAGHLWRLESSGRRSMGRLPAAFIRASRLQNGDGSSFTGACSVDENTVWIAGLLPERVSTDQLGIVYRHPREELLLRVEWNAETGSAEFVTPDPVSTLPCTPVTPFAPTVALPATPEEEKEREELIHTAPRPHFVAQVAGETFLVEKTATTDCEPTLRNLRDVRAAISTAEREGSRRSLILLSTFGFILVAAGLAGWRVRRQRVSG